MYVAISKWSAKGFPNNIETLNLACIEDMRYGFVYLKTTSMFANIMAKKEANSFGADEALLVRGNLNSNFYINEAASCNIFFIKDGIFYITPADGNIYSGTTRKRVIAILKSKNLKIIEKEISRDEMVEVNTIFTTATTSLIRQVREVLLKGEKIYDKDEIDPIVLSLAKSYHYKFMC